MADARRDAQWNHTASLMSLIANCHIDPKKHKPTKPTDFHPSHRSTGDAVAPGNIQDLKMLLGR
jgi:hypothetical protein